MQIALTGIIISLFFSPTLVAAATFDQVISGEQVLLLAETAKEDMAPTPESGSLVIPGETDARDKDKKQCLNVCKKWGEDCIINPRTGARNCRRACKEFGEECF